LVLKKNANIIAENERKSKKIVIITLTPGGGGWPMLTTLWPLSAEKVFFEKVVPALPQNWTTVFNLDDPIKKNFDFFCLTRAMLLCTLPDPVTR
jgi:hypothetical protein